MVERTELITIAAGSEENSLAVLIAELIRQNVERHPARKAHLVRLVLAATICATDLETRVTLVFNGHRGLVLHGESPVAPHVTIVADSESILDLARLSIHGPTGFPVLWDALGFSVVRRVLRKRVQIRPMGRHLGKLTRLLAILSVSS